MKYIANPVEVEAFEISQVIFTAPEGTFQLILSDGRLVVATREMVARMYPEPGDYWVVQSDGYVYLNPKAVFERKYRPASFGGS